MGPLERLGLSLPSFLIYQGTAHFIWFFATVLPSNGDECLIQLASFLGERFAQIVFVRVAR
jgi:hypothetical protein